MIVGLRHLCEKQPRNDDEAGNQEPSERNNWPEVALPNRPDEKRCTSAAEENDQENKSSIVSPPGDQVHASESRGIKSDDAGTNRYEEGIEQDI